MTIQARPIEITSLDGVVLRGQRWGSGPDWVVLLHDSGDDRDLDAWRPLLPAIMTPERTLMTLDLAGHGASDGEPESARLLSDLDAMLDAAAEWGATWIALAGAGDSARHILQKASSRLIDALVLLSPRLAEEQIHQLRGQGEPKLFAVGSRSQQLNANTRQARNASIGWAMLVSLPTEQQGTDLLFGAYSAQLIERIVAFLAEQRAIARTRLPRLSEPKRVDASNGEEKTASRQT